MSGNDDIQYYKAEIRSLLRRAALLFGVYLIILFVYNFVNNSDSSLKVQVYVTIIPILGVASVIVLATLWRIITIWNKIKASRK